MKKCLMRIASLLLALLFSLTLVGCDLEQASEAMQVAGDILELLQEESAEPASQEQTPAAAQAPPQESASAETIQEGTPAAEEPGDGPDEDAALPEDGEYDSKEEVALYLVLYGHLPDNYITKKEAEALGWPGGSLEPYAPGKCIGGSRFGNYEGLLPEKQGRTYTECDIDTMGSKSRGAKRIVFSNDGLVYYTDDHYESFELLYGEE